MAHDSARYDEPDSMSPIPIKVLVIGGSYGGVAAMLNILDLCNGTIPRSNTNYKLRTDAPQHIPVNITLVDERDGYCKFGERYIPKASHVLIRLDHLIGSPLAYAQDTYASKAWIK